VLSNQARDKGFFKKKNTKFCVIELSFISCESQVQERLDLDTFWCLFRNKKKSDLTLVASNLTISWQLGKK